VHDDAERPVRRARLVVAAAVLAAPLTTAVLPGIGVARETDPGRIVLGVIGVALVVITQCVVLLATLYREPDPSRSRRPARPTLPDLLLIGAVIVSVPLVAPVAEGSWATWAWLGGSVAGSLQLVHRRAVVLIIGWVLLIATAVLIGTVHGDPIKAGLTALAAGVMVAGACILPMILWRLVGELRAGRDARARLAVAEERLRFARDVHDLVGHTLSVIAVKAELVERLQPVDPDRAAAEAGQVRRLTSDALVQLRSTVDGYRGMDLDQQAAAVGEALDSAGIPYRMDLTERPGSAAVSRLLALALREATTNVLRHGGRDCVITLDRQGGWLRLRVINRVPEPAPAAGSRPGTGLAGMRERFAEVGGTVHAGREGDRFVFQATLPAEAS